MPLGELSFLNTLFLENEDKSSERSNVSKVQQNPPAKIQLFLNTFKMAKKCRGRTCPQAFNYNRLTF